MRNVAGVCGICAAALLWLWPKPVGAQTIDTVFEIPEILKGNVAFWKKIYTEVSLKSGLIHDRDYPMVIFEQVPTGETPAGIRQRKENISAKLKAMAAQPESTWGELERPLAELYKTHASLSALTDAADRVRFQQGQMERFREGLQRSGMYIDTIRAILRQYGVPQRLAYLPHVESSFNTHAYSKVGAAGLWQFMRGTGKLYGMKIDYTIDERRDPIIATIGAAKYLSSSYQTLKSWPLAITSYNHGVYGMKRAIAQTGSSDLAVIIQKYSSPSFRFASSNFYGCFLAASEVAANHATYFPSLTMHTPVRYAAITLEHYISPDVLSKHLNFPKERLIELNPAIRPAVFEQHKKLPKGFTIHIPAEIDASQALLAIAQIPDSLKSSEAERPLYYKVGPGDNLYAIATRLGVQVGDLAAENNLTKLNRIRAGQVLRVPGVTVPQPTVVAAAAVSAEKTVAETSVVTAAITPPSPPAVALPAPEPQPSEAVAEIAMAEANMSVPPQVLEADLKHPEAPAPVVIAAMPKAPARSPIWPPPAAAVTQPIPQKVAEPVVQPKVKEPKAEELTDSLREIALAPAIVEKSAVASQRPAVSPSFDITLYGLDVVLSSVGTSAEIRVSVDETIGHYADWLGVPTWRIRKLNEMGNTSDIRLNKKLHIPIDGQQALDRFVAARLEYHMALEEDFYAQYRVADVKSRLVKRGETLWDICNGGENQIPMWLFKKYNNSLDLARLMPQTTVWIPVVEEGRGQSVAVAPTGEPTTNPREVRVMEPVRRGWSGVKLVP